MDTTKGFGVYLDRTLRKIRSVYIEHFKRNNIDLTLEQWVILQRIYDLKDKASQTELTKLSFRNRATTSRVIGGLCNRKLIEKQRFEGDKKRFKLVITKTGRDIVKRTLPIIEEIRGVGYSELDEDEFSIFIKVLDKIWSNYDEFEVAQKSD